MYCIGIVLGEVTREGEGGDVTSEREERVKVSLLYAIATLLASPMVMLYPVALSRMRHASFFLACGCGFCFSLVLMALSRGRSFLFVSFFLTLLLGPGMLYPAAEGALLGWWRHKRRTVGAAAQAAGAALGMLVLPSLLSLASGENGKQWRQAYIGAGFLLLLPVVILSALLPPGGASDHHLRRDGEEGEGLTDQIESSGCTGLSAEGVAATEALAVSAASIRNGRGDLSEQWRLRDVLTHPTFWLAQISIITVDANVNALLFHRQEPPPSYSFNQHQSSPLPHYLSLSTYPSSPITSPITSHSSPFSHHLSLSPLSSAFSHHLSQQLSHHLSYHLSLIIFSSSNILTTYPSPPISHHLSLITSPSSPLPHHLSLLISLITFITSLSSPLSSSLS